MAAVAVAVPVQPQTLHADLIEQVCDPFENFPVSLPLMVPVTDA
jgi:hypothetical protein